MSIFPRCAESREMARLNIEQIRKDREELFDELGRMRRQFRELSY